VSVRNSPMNATNLGSVCPCRAVRRYHKPTRANRGPTSSQILGPTFKLCNSARTGSYSDKNHKKGSLRITIADGGRNRGEPFIGITIVFVLDNLVVVQR
jgi:hypothetical protein